MAHLLLDFDGTLVDSAPGILAAMASALAARGLEPTLPLQSSLIGPPLHETLRRVSGLQDTQAIESLALAFREEYDEAGFRHSVPYPGIEAALRNLHARDVALYIVTNKRIFPTRRILAHLGWQALFAEVVSLDSVTPAAADKAELMGRLLAARGIAADEAIMVGDTPEDAAAAMRNGVAFAAATWGYGRFSGTPETRMLDAPGDIADVIR